MFLKKATRKQNGKSYTYYYTAKSVRDPITKTPKNVLIENLGMLTSEEIEEWRLRLKVYSGKTTTLVDLQNIKFKEDKRYMDIALFSYLYDKLDIDDLFPSSEKKQVSTAEVAKVLTISRSLNPMANYKTSCWLKKTYLPEIMGTQAHRYNKDKIFDELINISKSRNEIQKRLIQLSQEYSGGEHEIYFLDGTTSFFEGGCCSLGEATKDKTTGYQNKVILILLVVDTMGSPVCWEVFSGRSSEKISIQKVLKRFQFEFKIKNVTFCFDRGFATKNNFDIIEDYSGLQSKFISALNRNQFEKVFDLQGFILKTRQKLIDDFSGKRELNKGKKLPINGFYRFEKDRYIRELSTKDGYRYVASFNINIYETEQKMRNLYINEVTSEIEKINNELSTAKNSRDHELLEDKILKTISKHKLSKIIYYEIVPKIIQSNKNQPIQIYEVRYTINEEEKSKAGITDGLLIYKTNHTESKDGHFHLKTSHIVGVYRDKYMIEQAFRHIKTFEELRPIYVYLEEHVRAHVDICMIAYFINNYIKNIVCNTCSLDEFHSLLSDYSRSCILDNGVGSDIALLKKLPETLRKSISLLNADKILSKESLKRLNLKLS